MHARAKGTSQVALAAAVIVGLALMGNVLQISNRGRSP
jgi:hypothetical protein